MGGAVPFCRLLGVVFVYRQDPESRQKTAAAIKARAKDGARRPLLIFPEGTNTNGRVLISFRPGPFRPGVPVQPVVLCYPHKYFNVAWRGKPGQNPFLMMLQFTNSLEVTILEQYTPSAEEQASARQFAEGVREAMRAVMDVPTTRHSYDDVFLAALAERSGIQQNFEVCVLLVVTMIWKRCSAHFCCCSPQ